MVYKGSLTSNSQEWFYAQDVLKCTVSMSHFMWGVGGRVFLKYCRGIVGNIHENYLFI